MHHCTAGAAAKGLAGACDSRWMLVLSGFLSGIRPGFVRVLSHSESATVSHRPSDRLAVGCRDVPSQVTGPNVRPIPAARNAGSPAGTALSSRTVPSSVLAQPGALKRARVPPTALPEPLGSPLTAFPAFGQGNLPVLLWTASSGLPRGFLTYAGSGHEGREPGRPACFLVSPLFDPGRRPGVDGSGRPSSRHPRRLWRAAEGKGGAAWRRDRSRAQPRTGPFGPSMARTHPLPAVSTVALPAPGTGGVIHSGKVQVH